MSVRGNKTKVARAASAPAALFSGLNLEVESLELSKLKPYARNARVHSPDQVKQIAASIAQFGFVNPVLVDENNEIIAGHGRVMAASSLGYKEVPALRLSHLSAGQKKTLRLADNRIALSSKWDADLVAMELGDIRALEDGGELFALTGFDNRELRSLLPDAAVVNKPEEDEDDVPAPPSKPKSKLGDMYLIGTHRLLCGSSTDEKDMARLMMGSDLADMVFTDPPYGNNLGYGRGQLGERRIKGDDDTVALEAFVPLAEKYLKDDRHFLAFTQWRTFVELWQAMARSSLKVRTVIVWDKKAPGLAGGGLAEQHEWLVVGIKGTAKQNMYSGNVWAISRENKRREESPHPHQKPVALICQAFDVCLTGGDLILECFAGSGSTMVAAHKMGKVCHAMELDEKYCDVIVKRMHKLYPDLTITCNGSPVPWLES